MVKILLLQQWYTLSDTLMEEALDDRIPFRRFVGLGLEDDTPDYSTISRFRTELANRGLAEKLFHELGRQLEKRGLFQAGTLMDATLVEAQVKRPPMSAGPGAKSTPPMRIGAARVVDHGHTSATRRISAWTQGPAWCARRSSHPPRCMRARWRTS